MFHLQHHRVAKRRNHWFNNDSKYLPQALYKSDSQMNLIIAMYFFFYYFSMYFEKCFQGDRVNSDTGHLGTDRVRHLAQGCRELAADLA